MSDQGSPPRQEEEEEEVEKKQAVSNKDVFGDSDEDEEAKPSQKSSGGGEDSDASGGGGSDSDDSGPKKKKKRKREDRKEKKEKKDRKEKEKKSRKKRRSAVGSDKGSDDERNDPPAPEANAFLGSDDEESALRNGDVIDTQTGEVIKEKSGRKKLTKRERDQLGMKERQLNMAFVAKLKEAACDDKDAFKKKQMATKKLEMLPKVITELSSRRKQQDYLNAGVLDALKLWLDTLDDSKKASSLPNKKLIGEVLELLIQLPIDADHRKIEIIPQGHTVDNMDFVTQSKIGHSVALIKHLLRDDKKCPVYRAATRVIQKWSRIIFKKSETYSKIDDENDEDPDASKPQHARANRKWEKMPENVNAEGNKAVKGEYGFRYGASVPRPMLFDFIKQPENKVDIEEKAETAKERKNETRERLSKITQETRRATVDGRNSRAEAPELNRMHVGGVAAKVASMGWAVRKDEK